MRISEFFSKLRNYVRRRLNWYCFDPIARRTFKPLDILDSFKSIQYIIDNRCSVSRYGDGELSFFYGVKVGFQDIDDKLIERLEHILKATDAPNHIVGIPYFLKDVSGTVKGTREFWGLLARKYGRKWSQYFYHDRKYLDTQLSRFFREYKDYDRATKQLEMLKRIWDGRDVIIVEGNQSRTGIGNDLYDNAKSLKRILGYARNAFSHYDEMLEAVKNHVNPEDRKLILLSYGPTATILAYDLAKLGYQAVDIGHLDIEYEWYLNKDYKGGKIKGKYTNEAKGGDSVDDCDNSEYHSQIICDITKGEK